MTFETFTRIGALLSALLLASCNHYSEPAYTPDASATVIGSRTDDVEASFVSVDERGLRAGRPDWNQSVVIEPGLRIIGFVVGRPGVNPLGRADAKLQVEAGKSYILRGSPAEVMFPGCVQAMGWIEDEDGKLVTEKLPITVTRFTPGTTIMLPNGGFITTPGKTSATTCPN